MKILSRFLGDLAGGPGTLRTYIQSTIVSHVTLSVSWYINLPCNMLMSTEICSDTFLLKGMPGGRSMCCMDFILDVCATQLCCWVSICQTQKPNDCWLLKCLDQVRFTKHVTLFKRCCLKHWEQCFRYSFVWGPSCHQIFVAAYVVRH